MEKLVFIDFFILILEKFKFRVSNGILVGVGM